MAKAKVQQSLAIHKEGDLGWGRDRRALTQHQMEEDLEPWTAAQTSNGVGHGRAGNHQAGALEVARISKVENGVVDGFIKAKIIGMAFRPRVVNPWLQPNHMVGCDVPNPVVHSRWREHKNQRCNRVLGPGREDRRQQQA